MALMGFLRVPSPVLPWGFPKGRPPLRRRHNRTGSSGSGDRLAYRRTLIHQAVWSWNPTLPLSPNPLALLLLCVLFF